MNKAMQRALELDGEKLRQLTGKDHGPHYPQDDAFDHWEDYDICQNCDSEGSIQVASPQQDDPYYTETKRCPTCEGAGYIPHKTLGEQIVAEAFAAFDKWCRDHDPEGDMSELERAAAYGHWCDAGNHVEFDA